MVRKMRISLHVGFYLSALLLSAFSLIPILWGVSTSLKSESMVYKQPPEWIPSSPTLENYLSILRDQDMLGYFRNTVIISTGATVFSLIIGIMAAYGFSRFKFRGKNVLLVSILFTTLFPKIVIMIPLYMTLKDLTLLNTYTGLILVYMIVVLPIAVWLLKGYFDKIPYEVEEAAIMDGCSIWSRLWRIVIPISLPGIAAVGLFSFIVAWNDFWFALIYSFGKETRTQSVALGFFITQMGIQWGKLMAGTVLVSIPSILVFAFAQKLLVNGLSDGAVKG
ncbi:carbohydrate ABC transporter permease [Paenibacillus beijingensis]|uniref:ABC transmembrane type-1 domain-containing protein n=1 Tax=Paenibacillus beijingensis TaxID=1126833 RepID=A0A0D5NKK8_9BACL|nr:carbohydrate ABC transporter permease [Paenibacillus beijingensis]AJY75645.1 hypothetical protein VN24_15105 [Paenibacillus beijingensis]